MIQFIAGFIVGAIMVALCCINSAGGDCPRIDEGPMLPEVDEHGRTIYRSENKE
jgi:hypothetical protein